MSPLATAALPLLLRSREAAQVCGVSVATFQNWVNAGKVPPEVRHPASFGGWPRYSRHLLEQWLAGQLEATA